MKPFVLALALVSSVLLLVRCGGSSSAQPTPLPSAPAPTPTPLPTPPPKPLSVIPPCALPATNPSLAQCPPANSVLGADVNAAVDRVVTERPDLFDLNDVNGGPKIKDYDGYMTAVVAALGEAGLCGKVDAEGEIGVKLTNSWSEQWIIWSSQSYVRRKYLYGCKPSVF